MALFSDSKMAGRVTKLEADQKKILSQNEQILASLAKLTGETPAPKQEDPEDEEPKAKKKAVAPKETKAKEADPEDEDPEEEQEDEDPENDAPPEDEEEDEDSDEEMEDEEESPKAKKGKSQVKQAAAPSNSAVMKELKSLRKQIAGGSQKSQAATISKIGIQPLRRVDKPVGSDAGHDDPLEHTRQAWSKPIRK